MLIDLPPVHEYSMADCQDLFVSKVVDDFDDIDGYNIPNSKNDNLLRVPHDRGVRGHLSDAEPFTYTSSSESDADVFFSDIDVPKGAIAGETSEKQDGQKDLALHSPGQLLGTPRDPSRRYEYPFPVHLKAGQSESDYTDDSSASSSVATTPGFMTDEGYSLGLVPLPMPPPGVGISSLSAGLPMQFLGTTPAPVPIPVPTTNGAHVATKRPSIASLSQISLVPDPSSGSAFSMSSGSGISTSTSASSAVAHPKLSRFNPANTPVPPGLRDRSRRRKSASISYAMNSSPNRLVQAHAHASRSVPDVPSMVASESITGAVPAVSIMPPSTTVKGL